jgi:hypothetical protein
MTQLGEGECLTVPIRIYDIPNMEEPWDQMKDKMAQRDIDAKDDVFIATNADSLKYRDKYVTAWEKTFLEVVPKVLTDKEKEEEEKEIENS